MWTITSPKIAWVLVLLSGALEVVFSVSMKLSDGYRNPWYSALSIGSAIASVWLMGTTLSVLPVGTAYAVWAGMGAAGTALVGMYLLGEPATLVRFACIAAVVAGIIGLQLSSAR
jgi:quaternary ammonium compound-resistance protein SugE